MNQKTYLTTLRDRAYTVGMTHSIYTADIYDDDLDSMVTVDIRTLNRYRLHALLDEAAAAGEHDFVDVIESVLCPRALAERIAAEWHADIVDGDVSADDLLAMMSDRGLVTTRPSGVMAVIWLTATNVVAWLGNNVDEDMGHIGEIRLDLEDGWQRLYSSAPAEVAGELAEGAGYLATEDDGAALRDGLESRGLLRRRGSAREIVEIRRMTDDSYALLAAEILA